MLTLRMLRSQVIGELQYIRSVNIVQCPLVYISTCVRDARSPQHLDILVDCSGH